MATILVVDDDAMNLKMAEFILSKNGYGVNKVSSGEEAIDFLKGNVVDLILLDIEMPGMNGFDTLAEIKNIDSARSIPVMFLSASVDEADLNRANDMGAVGYVKKPFMPPVLLEQIGKVLQ